nr:hypothetical protein 2 [Moraxellaceae bacterium]
MGYYCEYHRMILELVDYALESSDEKIVALAKYTEELVNDNRQMDFDLNFVDKVELEQNDALIEHLKEQVKELEQKLKEATA